MRSFASILGVALILASAVGCSSRALPQADGRDRRDGGTPLDRTTGDIHSAGGDHSGDTSVADGPFPEAKVQPLDGPHLVDIKATADVLLPDATAPVDGGHPVDIHAAGDAAGPSTGNSTVAIGEEHACGIGAGGITKCWGDGTAGQLGAGVLKSSSTPVAVTTGLMFTALTAGSQYTCAISAAGDAWCWGTNANGQLGTGTAGSSSNVPVQVVGLAAGVTSVSAGFSHTCAISVGTTYCWGTNAHGQVGNGTTGGSVATPQAVKGLSTVVRVTTGFHHSCAVESAGSVRCWGANYDGQLGTGGGNADSSDALPVIGLPGPALDVRAGAEFTCALTLAGAVYCWGYDGSGQLGNGTTTTAYVPTPVAGLGTGVVAIATGLAHACALLNTGSVQCWGLNDLGQLGTGGLAGSSAPKAVAALPSSVVEIAAGYYETCARSASATWCWGNGKYGQLGVGPVAAIGPPRIVPALAGAVALSSSQPVTCRLGPSGAVACLGFNNCGQFGVGNTEPSVSLVSPLGLVPAVSFVAMGIGTMCALDAGSLKCSGCMPATSKVPQLVPGITGMVTAVALGGYSGCLVEDQAARCWGGNNFGQLGQGNTGYTPATAPQTVPGLDTAVTGVAAGDEHVCAIQNGAVKCWGRNNYGQVGDGSWTYTIPAPVAVSGSLVEPVTAVAAGYGHTCAIDAVGMQCWGWNGAGQIGNGGTTDAHSPVPVGLPGKPSAISLGNYHTCALVSGNAYCWGNNLNLQVDGSTIKYSSTPVLVKSLPAGAVSAVVAAGDHTFALTTDGTVYAWGSNSYGVLGLGFAENTPLPVLVSGL